MQIVINISDEQIKKSLEESKYIHEDEGEKSSVDIVILCTNGYIDSVNVSRKTDFYSCKYKILPKGHGRLIDADAINLKDISPVDGFSVYGTTVEDIDLTPTIIEADRSEEHG